MNTSHRAAGQPGDARLRRRWRTIAHAALAALAMARPVAAEPAESTDAPLVFEGRGIYYVEGAIPSPVGGVGARSAFATNRIAVDDEHTTVRVDRAARRIVFRNAHRYGLDALVGCVLLVGRGTTEAGESVPTAVHLKIHKTLDHFTTKVHPHPTVRGRLTRAEFEPFEIVLSDGRVEKTALTPERAEEVVRDPEAAARLVGLFMQVTDHLEGRPIEIERAGAPLIDLSFGFGTTEHNMKLARVSLLSNDPKNAELIRAGSVAAMLERGDWEFRVDSLTPYIPKWEFERDFFLFGLEGVDAIRQIAKRGLLRGETLTVGIREGRGYIGVGDRRSEIADPADVARAYLEFHFVGGVVARQVAELPGRLP